jgi:hypothetical protein
MDEIIVRYINLPPSVKGLTVRDSSGDYNIYINYGLGENIRDQALEHEKEHIKKQHFDKNELVNKIEKEAETTPEKGL